MPIATLTSKGQITVPKAIRSRLHLTTGDQLAFTVTEDGEVVIRRAGGKVSTLIGRLRQPGRRPVTLPQMDAAVRRAVADKTRGHK